MTINAIIVNPESKAYYKRNEADRKTTIIVLNAAQLKLICHIFSVVKKGRSILKKHQNRSLKFVGWNGYLAMVAFPGPSILFKVKADLKNEAGYMHSSYHCMNTMVAV